MGVGLDLAADCGRWWRRGFDVYEGFVVGGGVVLEIEVEVPGADDAIAAGGVEDVVVLVDG